MAFNQFDSIAGVYDRLAKLVFGKSIIASQQLFLSQIPHHANVLILGGGTGWILKEIANTNTPCEIWYIDASAKMIEQAKKRNVGANRVHFIHGTENDIPPAISFNILITNFYLDLFDEKNLASVLEKVTCAVTHEAHWIVTDFVDGGRRWQRLLLTIMYSFFRVITQLQNRALPDWDRAIRRKGYRKLDSKLFFHGFIESAVYCKR